LTELQGIGLYLEKVVRTWFKDAPLPPSPAALRSGFLTFTQAHAILAAQPEWMQGLNGDLQMHSLWSDGSASIAEMPAAAVDLDYEYIAITDHAKGLKIASGIDEAQLREQASEIASVNRSLEGGGHKLRVLRSIELNLNPEGQGDMEPPGFESGSAGAGAQRQLSDFVWNRCSWTEPVAIYDVRCGVATTGRYYR
jgi:hypothetical protein